jgi:hypothetical protein
MNNESKISIINLERITLDYVLEHCNNDNWTDGEVAKSRYSSDTGADTNKDIRDVDVSLIDSKLYSLLSLSVEPHIMKYAQKHDIKISQNVGYSLARYSSGQFFAEHTDSTKEFPRKVSAILYLNDNYSGGTITFTKLNKTFKPKANTLFIFPSTDDFSHSADPVIDGTKYVIVGFWL